MDRCASCDCTHLPVCDGQYNPISCTLPKHQRVQKSLYRRNLLQCVGSPDRVVAGARFIRPWMPGSPIRVGLATPSLCVGGAERWIFDLIRATSAEPFEWIGLAVLKPERSWPPITARAEALTRVRNGTAAIAELARDVDLLVTWGIPDVHSMLGGAGCRTIAVSHNAACDPWTVQSLRDSGQATSCAAVAVAAVDAFPVADRQRVRVIYNTATEVTPTVSREEQRRLWGVPAGKRLIGFLGRITEQKQPERFAMALAELVAHSDEWVGVMVGPYDGEGDKVRFLELVDRLQLGPRLILPGPTDSPANALIGFDVLVMPSLYEAHSLAINEAWALGVPVVATAVAFTAEHPELIRVIPPSWAFPGVTVANQILADQADPEGTAARVALAQRFMRDQLGFDRFAAEWRSLFLETMGNEPGKAPRTAQELLTAPGATSGPAELGHAQAARAAKPRIPLGQPHCVPCVQAKNAAS